MIVNIFKVFHYIICFLLIWLIFLQSGSNTSLVNIFGSGSQQIFNVPSGTSFIKKVTILVSCTFIFNAFLLTKYLS
jgi:protein translocase SecG subunit